MRRPQPPHRIHSDGSSRHGNYRDRSGYHGTSHQNNGNQPPSRNASSSQQQQTRVVNGSAGRQPPISPGDSRDPRNGQTQNVAHGQPDPYAPVHRSWGYLNPEIAQVINDRALGGAPPPHAQHFAPYYAPPQPPPSPPAVPPNGGNGYRLTLDNLEQLNQHLSPRDPVQIFERQSQRTGPYNAEGGIRQDRQIYEEDPEWSDGYHDYH